MSEEASHRSYTLDLRFHFPRQRPGPGKLSLEFPQWGEGVWVRRLYWQLVLPHDEHVLTAPAGFTNECVWSWEGYFWGRKPLLGQAELEAWVGATGDLSDPSGTNHYLFSTMGNVPRGEVHTADRFWIVLIASGATLVAGLILIYLPASRHPASLFALALALLCAGSIYPEPTLLVAQAAGLGLVMTLVAGLLQRGVARRRQAVTLLETAQFDSGERFHADPVPDAHARQPRLDPVFAGRCDSQPGPERMNRRMSPVSSIAWMLLAVALSWAAGATWLWPRAAWSAVAEPSVAEKPGETTSEKAPERPAEKPSEKPLERPAEKPSDKPAESGGKPAEKVGEKPVEPISFRRVYAPADRLKDWPYGNVTYMPIEAAEFERLLEVVGSAIPGTRTSFAAQVTAARYEARLVGGQWIEGTARLDVVHSGESAALMPLDPCGLAVGKARWVKGASKDATNAAAGNGQAGVTVRAADPKQRVADGQAADEAQNAGVPSGIDPGVEAEAETTATLGLGTDDRLGVLVERSGQLSLDWSLVGSSDASGAISYAFELPPCPTNLLVLDLPAEMTPTVDRGELIEESPEDEGQRRWRIELGGHHRFILRVAPSDAADGTSQLAIARESVIYDFSLPGVNVNAKLTLEVHDQPLQKVALVLDPGLRLVTVRCGDGSIPWSVASTGDGQTTRVELTFPEAIRDKQCVVQIAALAALQVDRLWQLPRIRPEGTFWQEGTVTLWVPAPLVMQQLVPAGCRQTGTGLLSAPRVGETAEFQCFSPDAAVEVLLTQRPESVQISSGTALELSGGEMTALVKARFRSAERSLFSLHVDVAPQWMIDSVESLPAEALDDWTLERQNGSRQRLSVRLANAVSSDTPLSLLITARRLHSPLGGSFGIRDILPLQFEASPESKHLVAIEAVGPYQIELSGTQRVAFIDSHSLDGAERELFDDLPRGLLLKNDEDAGELRVALESQKPSYAGTIHVEAIVGEGTLRENYVFRVIPKTVQTSAQRVRRVVACLGSRRDLPVHWTLGAEGDQQLSARRLSNDEQAAAGLDTESEVWELTLLRPRNANFELRATRDVELAPRQPIRLASLPEATSQQASLVVRSLGSKTVRIEENHLTPSPVEAVPPDQQQTARAMYRYDPTDLTATASATLTVADSGDAETSPTWAWNCHLESRYEANGTGRHLVTYRLQSSAGGTMRLTLPAGVTAKDVEGVWIDDNRIMTRRTGGPGVQVPGNRSAPGREVPDGSPALHDAQHAAVLDRLSGAPVAESQSDNPLARLDRVVAAGLRDVRSRSRVATVPRVGNALEPATVRRIGSGGRPAAFRSDGFGQLVGHDHGSRGPTERCPQSGTAPADAC